MSFQWRRIMTMLGFLGCLAMLSPACVVRARARVKPAYVVDERPPPPRYRKDVRDRPGHVWVRGHWEWRGSRWVWRGGHWVQARSGFQWEHGHWERRGNRWHWVEGEWNRVGAGRRHVHQPDRDSRRPAPGHRRPAPGHSRPAPGRGGVKVRDHRYPTKAPPAPKAESPGQRNGYVWVGGRWDWKGGDWAWKPGHWERARSGHRWNPGRWERQGSHYEWVEGGWIEAKGGVKVRDHRNKRPKPQGRKNRRVPVRRGN